MSNRLIAHYKCYDITKINDRIPKDTKIVGITRITRTQCYSSIRSDLRLHLHAQSECVVHVR